MKDRLSVSDWLRVAGNVTGGSAVVLVGRIVQLLAAAVLLAGLGPTLGAIVTWLRTGAWTTPTPLGLAPEITRAVAGATDWVVVQRVLVWLAGHHVLWTALPLAALIALPGVAIVSAGQARRGRAGDLVSQSLRDEYLVREGWARWRGRLAILLAALLLAAGAAAVYLTIIR